MPFPEMLIWYSPIAGGECSKDQITRSRGNEVLWYESIHELEMYGVLSAVAYFKSSTDSHKGYGSQASSIDTL